MRIIGIDPGVTGAMATMADGRMADVSDLPMLDGTLQVVEFIDYLRYALPDMVVVEDTQPMPKNGSIASFKLGLNTGLIRAAIQATELPLTRVKPVVWKRHLGLIGTNKDRSLLLARELYPHLNHQLRLAKHHNRADACLITRWYAGTQIHAMNGDSYDRPAATQ
jgi:hypothetical protein